MAKKKQQNKGWIDFNTWKKKNLPKRKNTQKTHKNLKNTHTGNFINPYNFVSVPLDKEISDRSEPSCFHHEYCGDSYTGRLVCSLEVITPLFIPDSSDREKIDGGKKGEKLGFNKSSDGKPEIPATSLKGMLRSIYETITSSCYSQLNAERLDFRNVKIAQSFTLSPAVVTELDRKKKHIKLSVLDAMAWLPAYRPGRDLRNNLHKNGNPPRAHANMKKNLYIVKARISRRLSEKKKKRLAKLKNKYNATVSRKKEFRADKLTEKQKTSLIKDLSQYIKGNIRIIQYDLVTEKLQKNPSKLSPSGTGVIQHEVLVKNTGKTISNKHDERVFYSNRFQTNLVSNLNKLTTKKIPFECVIDLDYILSEQFERFRKRDGDSAAKQEMEMRLNRGGDIEVAGGDLVYYLEKKGRQNLAIVLVPRLRYTRSPADLLPEKLRPCSSLKSLCPACKLFGFTPDNKNAGSTKSLKGRLYFSSATPKPGSQISFKENTLLKILGSPHPTSTNFYLTNKKEKKTITVENGGYDAKNAALRGRKFYWVQGNGEHPLSESAFKSSNPAQASPFNRWVELLEPGTVFTFNIDFENLTQEELSLLLWAIELDDGMYHRLGMGKPLGLGTVKLTIDSGKSYILTTKDIKDYYSDLEQKPGVPEAALSLDRLKKDAQSRIEKLSFYSDLKAILSYQKDIAPLLKYPQKGRRISGRTEFFGYEWFSSNKDQALCSIEEIIEDNCVQTGWEGGTI